MPENSADKFLDCERLWIVVGDIHENLGNFARIPELARAEGVIVSGDLTNGGGAKKAAKILTGLRAAGKPVFAQIGNMDKADVNDFLSGEGVNIHGSTREIAADTVIFGVGGSTITPMKTCSEFPEEAYAAWLADEWRAAKDYPVRILISHNPPKDTKCDAINESLHVGSRAVREFIEREQPEICVCGHIHEGRAVDNIGKTTIVNPGTLADGGYVVICYKDGRAGASLASVKG